MVLANTKGLTTDTPEKPAGLFALTAIVWLPLAMFGMLLQIDHVTSYGGAAGRLGPLTVAVGTVVPGTGAAISMYISYSESTPV